MPMQHLGFIVSVANLLAVNHGLVEPPEKTLIAQDHQFRDPAYIKVGGSWGGGVSVWHCPLTQFLHTPPTTMPNLSQTTSYLSPSWHSQGILATLPVPAWAPTDEKIELEGDEKKEVGADGNGASEPAAAAPDAMEVEEREKNEAEEREALVALIAELEAMRTEVRGVVCWTVYVGEDGFAECAS